MVEEAAKALVPGPVATTALATLVVVRSAAARRTRVRANAPPGWHSTATSSSTRRRLGRRAPCRGCWAADADGLLLVPAGDKWLLIDAAAGGVAVEPLQATDFSRPLARVVLTSAPAAVLDASAERVADLAATVLSAEAAGITRWTLDTAVAYAKVREQFGKPIGSFQAIKHLCAEMLLPRRAGGGGRRRRRPRRRRRR